MFLHTLAGHSKCPRDYGFCYTQAGDDQNAGVVSLGKQTEAECLRRCKEYKGATGCERFVDQANCYVHTQALGTNGEQSEAGAHSHDMFEPVHAVAFML